MGTLMVDSVRRYQIPSWIATRVFRPTGVEPRAVISNELDHEFVTLDGPSVNVWDALWQAGSAGLTAAEIHQRHAEFTMAEIEAFLEELHSANLLTTAQSAAKARRSLQDAVPAPESGRYAGGGYVEPTAGGDNLQEEFEFQDWAILHGFLWSAAWEMTYRCNESCIHCFNPGASHGPDERPMRKTAELTLAEAKKMLLEMQGLGVFRLLLTGGEVLLRKDFFDIVAEARRLGFSVTVFTNGTLLDDTNIEWLTDLYPHRVELTLYSTQERHDAITRLKDSFDKTVAAARALVARGVTVAIKTSVMRDTAFDHRELRALCEEIGCEYNADFNLSAGVDGARSPLTQLSLLPESLIRNALDSTTSLWVGSPESPHRLDLKAAHGQHVCGAGRTTMAISPEGHVYPCNSLPIHMGSMRGNEGLAAVWRGGRIASQAADKPQTASTLAQWQGVVRGSYHVCGKFERCAWCQKCPGMAYLETGDELAPSVSNCRTAAARRIAFDLVSEQGAEQAALHIDTAFLQQRYADEVTLWADETVVQRVSLDAVKQKLRERTKAAVLLNECEAVDSQ